MSVASTPPRSLPGCRVYLQRRLQRRWSSSVAQWLIAVACGDVRLDNGKCKEAFGGKVKMASPEETQAVTGHPVGGVSPSALPALMPTYFDIRLRQFQEVVSGAGATTHALRIPPQRLAELANAQWVDICT